MHQVSRKLHNNGTYHRKNILMVQPCGAKAVDTDMVNLSQAIFRPTYF